VKYIKLFIVINVMNLLSCGLLMAESSRGERTPQNQPRSEHKKMPVKSREASRDDEQEDREKSKPFWNGFTRGLGEGTGRVVGEVGAEVGLRLIGNLVKVWIDDPASHKKFFSDRAQKKEKECEQRV